VARPGVGGVPLGVDRSCVVTVGVILRGRVRARLPAPAFQRQRCWATGLEKYGQSILTRRWADPAVGVGPALADAVRARGPLRNGTLDRPPLPRHRPPRQPPRPVATAANPATLEVQRGCPRPWTRCPPPAHRRCPRGPRPVRRRCWGGCPRLTSPPPPSASDGGGRKATRTPTGPATITPIRTARGVWSPATATLLPQASCRPGAGTAPSAKPAVAAPRNHRAGAPKARADTAAPPAPAPPPPLPPPPPPPVCSRCRTGTGGRPRCCTSSGCGAGTLAAAALAAWASCAAWPKRGCWGRSGAPPPRRWSCAPPAVLRCTPTCGRGRGRAGRRPPRGPLCRLPRSRLRTTLWRACTPAPGLRTTGRWSRAWGIPSYAGEAARGRARARARARGQGRGRGRAAPWGCHAGPLTRTWPPAPTPRGGGAVVRGRPFRCRPVRWAPARLLSLWAQRTWWAAQRLVPQLWGG
jgi:hypothetical protein